jgi:membrane protease YdiL (CAAX protease family)
MKKKFEKFIFKTRNTHEIIYYFIFSFVLLIIYSLSIYFLFYLIYPDRISDGQNVINSILRQKNNGGFIVYFMITFFAAVVEELFFRFPITIYITEKINILIKILLTFTLSAIFTIIHFANSTNIVYLFPFLIQGMLGLVLSFLFIISGANNGKNYQALSVVILFHLLWNLLWFSFI